MLNIFAPQYIITALIGRLLIKKLFRFEIEVVIGTIIYFLYLVSKRLLLGTVDLGTASWRASRQIRVNLPQKKEVARTVLDINSVYRLNGLEVVLGFDKSERPIRVDLDKYHTLIAGETGFGKTNLMNMIIAQLVTRPYFRDEYDLYLVDLKGSQKDYLALWKPVVKAYWSLDDSGSSNAIVSLSDFVDNMHRGDSGKIKVVIIDEVANLTSQSTDRELRKSGFAILMRISAQLRDVGALVCITQRPHFQTIERGVTSNLGRKVCLRVDDMDTAKMVTRLKNIKTDCTNFKHGEFLLREPGARNPEQVGRAMLVKVPEEIDMAVASVIEIDAESDERLKIFKMATAGLAVGDDLPGVRREFWKNSGLNVETVRTAYKNFHLSGAIQAFVDRRGQPNRYTLVKEFGDGYRLVLEYIQAGKWESAPETIGRNGHEAQAG